MERCRRDRLGDARRADRYFVGSAAAKAIGTYGAIATGGTILFTVIGLLIVRRVEKRVTDEDPDKDRHRIDLSGARRATSMPRARTAPAPAAGANARCRDLW